VRLYSAAAVQRLLDDEPVDPDVEIPCAPRRAAPRRTRAPQPSQMRTHAPRRRYMDFLNVHEHNGAHYHVIPCAVRPGGRIHLCSCCHRLWGPDKCAATRYEGGSPRQPTVERGPGGDVARVDGYYASNAPLNSIARGRPTGLEPPNHGCSAHRRTAP